MMEVEERDMVYRLSKEIASVSDVSVDELPPIGRTVDVGAIEAFLQSATGPARVEFSYRGLVVTVAANGRIRMSEPTGENGPYVSHCNSCEEERRGVDLETAQDFFGEHVKRGHEVEIVRDETADPPRDDGGGSDPDGTERTA